MKEKKSVWRKSLSAQLLCHGHSVSRQVHIKKNLGNFYWKWSLQRRMWFLLFKDVTKWESTWNWTTQRMRTNLGLVWAKPMIWRLRTKRERVKDPMPAPAPSPRLPSYCCYLDTGLHKTELRNNPVLSKDNLGPFNLPSWEQHLCHWLRTAGLAIEMLFHLFCPKVIVLIRFEPFSSSTTGKSWWSHWITSSVPLQGLPKSH